MKKIKFRSINLTAFLLASSIILGSKTNVEAYSISSASNYGYQPKYIREIPLDDTNTPNFLIDFETVANYKGETLNKDLLNYSGMALDYELEDYIKDRCYEVIESDIYSLDITGDDLFRIMMTIGEKESNGTWDCDGKISKTNDYGQFQINKCNHEIIYENLGYTTEDLLNDRYKNTDAAIYLICDRILTHPKCKTIDDVFGMYNGWSNWKNISRSVKYSDNCLNIMEEYFGTRDYEDVKELER